MNLATGVGVPGWFRAVAVLALIWNLVGVYGYLAHVGIAPAGEMSEAQRALEASIPVWATSAYAVAVFAGALGALGLVLRAGWSVLVLWISLIGVLVLESWMVFLSGAAETMGSGALVLPAVITAVAVLLVWLAHHARRRGWLA